MKISELCLAILAGIPALVSAAAVPPPPASRGSPAYLIYQDVDYIAYPANKTTVCKDLKQFRQTCWQQGIDKGSARAEHECLCSSEVAYSVVQCFSAQYNNLTSDALRAAYYEDFLTYTYDCYCGVTGVDVTYNTTVNPPKPYIAGYTGDAILPPEGGCPTTAPPANACPQQPCNCVPPPKPVIPATCPSGYDRCNGKCIQKPPVCEPCEYPFYRGFDGKCVCPNGFFPDGDTCRTDVPCPPNSDLVISHYSAYCVCDPGYVSYHDNFGDLVCTLCCPEGETRQPDGTCTKDCPNGETKAWDGTCICREGTTRGSDGTCVPSCTPPLIYSTEFGGCGCYYPYYYDVSGNCVLPACNDPVATCYTGIPTSTAIETVTSIAPPFNGTTTAIWMPTDTASIIVTGADTTAIPASEGASTVPTGGSTTPTGDNSTPTLPTGSGGDDSTTPTPTPTDTATSDEAVPTTPPSESGGGSGGEESTSLAAPTLPSSGGGGGGSGSGSGGGDSGSGGGGGSSGGGSSGGGSGGSSGGGDSGSGGSGGSNSGSGGSGGSDSGSGSSGGSSGGGDSGSSGSGGGSGSGDSGSGSGSGSSGGGGDGGSGGSGSGSGSGDSPSATTRLRRRHRWL